MKKPITMEQICEGSGCTPEQVRKVAGLVMKALHKIAMCDERSITGVILQSYWLFGEEACYHLGGILEEYRMLCAPDSVPWSETYERFAPELKKFRPVVESWMEDRSEERKSLDEQWRA